MEHSFCQNFQFSIIKFTSSFQHCLIAGIHYMCILCPSLQMCSGNLNKLVGQNLHACSTVDLKFNCDKHKVWHNWNFMQIPTMFVRVVRMSGETTHLHRLV